MCVSLDTHTHTRTHAPHRSFVLVTPRGFSMTRTLNDEVSVVDAPPPIIESSRLRRKFRYFRVNRAHARYAYDVCAYICTCTLKNNNNGRKIRGREKGLQTWISTHPLSPALRPSSFDFPNIQRIAKSSSRFPRAARSCGDISKAIVLAIERPGRRRLISSAFTLADSSPRRSNIPHPPPPHRSSTHRCGSWLATRCLRGYLRAGGPARREMGGGWLRQPRVAAEEEEEVEEGEEGRGEFPTRGV